MHTKALRNYVDSTLKCTDAVLRPDGNRIIVNFACTRPKCPYHNRVHDNENMYARLMNHKDAQGLVLYCYREMQGEVKWNDRVVIPVEQKENNILDDLKDELDELQQPVLDQAIPTTQRYVELLPMVRDSKTIFLRSQLGTGKTEAVMRLIQEKGYQKVLYLSFRKTFSQALATRFAPIGNVLLYSDVRGAMYHQGTDGTHYRMIVCQIEALSRYHDACDLLVVDEWESIMSQMNSAYALSTTDVVDALKRAW